MNPSILIPKLDVLRRIALARSGIASSMSRRPLDGILLEPSGPEHVVAVATNGMVAAWARIQTWESLALPRPVIVPGLLVKHLAKAKSRKGFIFSPPDLGLTISFGPDDQPAEFRLRLRLDSPVLLVNEQVYDPRNPFPAWRKCLPRGEVRLDPSGMFGSNMLNLAEEVLGEDGYGNPVSFRRRALTSDGVTFWATHNGVSVGIGSMKYSQDFGDFEREVRASLMEELKAVEVANG